MPKPESALLSKLIKLLNLTTSPNQGEALSAVSMANNLVAKLGTTWDELLTGKVTLIADPFTSIPEPPKSAASAPPAYTPSPPPPHVRRQPPPRPGPTNTPPIYTYACAHCGSHFHSTNNVAAGTQPFCSSFCCTAYAHRPKQQTYSHMCINCHTSFSSLKTYDPYCGPGCATTAANPHPKKPRPTVRRKGKQIHNVSDLLKGF